jgi:tetratricopeptide (TPR) repeat protein
MTDSNAQILAIKVRLKQALVQHRAGQLSDAEALYQGILNDAPEQPDALHLLGLIRGEQGQEHIGIELIERALRKRPLAAAYHHNIAGLYRRVGEMALAKARFQDAFTLKPDYGEAYQGYAEMVTFAPQDPFLDAVEQQLTDLNLNDQTRCYLHFAAGKYLDDTAEYDQAFKHYESANGLAARSFSVAKNRQFFQDLVYFQPDLQSIEARGGSVGDQPMPIFVVGMPRSGTSLVEQILASHSRVFGAGELNDLATVSLQLAQTLRAQSAPAGMRRDESSRLVQVAVDQARARYLHALRDRDYGEGIQWIVDKHPLNFRFLGLLRAMIPGVKIVHVSRHPLDTCLSCFFQNFTKGQDYSFNLTDLGQYYLDYQRLMNHWSAVPGLNIHTVTYESLLASPQSVIESLLAFCELPFEPACLRFYDTIRTVSTASFNQVRQPIYQTSKARWRHYAQHLGPLARMLDLDAESPAMITGSKL